MLKSSRVQRWRHRLAMFAVGAGVLLLGGYANEQRIAAREQVQFPPAGRLVQVGDHRLHLDCTGPVGTGPTVVLEAGMGGWSRLWYSQQPALSKHLRVCSYDRAGYGWSEPGRAPRTVDALATELHDLLANAGERPPYLLTGASFGGLVVRKYHQFYPAEVSALVLLDPVHEDELQRLPPAFAEHARQRPSWFRRRMPLVAQLGLARVQKLLAPDFIPAAQVDPLFADLLKPTQIQAQIDEEDAWPRSDAQMRPSASLGDIPVLVVSATEGGPPDIMAGRQRLHADIARLSTRGRQCTLPGLDHTGYIFVPRFAAMVNGAILRIARLSMAGAVHAPAALRCDALLARG